MNRHVLSRRLLPFLVIAAMTMPLAGQATSQKSGKAPTEADLANARPGRDPNQPIDEEYTKKIKQHTTETFFLSPLVDYLPASKTVPTPKAVLGDIAGRGRQAAVHQRGPRLHAAAREIDAAREGLLDRHVRGRARDDRRRRRVRGADGEARSEQGGPRQAGRPSHDQDGRRGGGRDCEAGGAGLLHHRHDSFDRGGRADGADGAGVPAGGRRQPLHPQHPRARDHADHAGRRSRTAAIGSSTPTSGGRSIRKRRR